jgi:hypothetical protein
MMMDITDKSLITPSIAKIIPIISPLIIIKNLTRNPITLIFIIKNSDLRSPILPEQYPDISLIISRSILYQKKTLILMMNGIVKSLRHLNLRNLRYLRKLRSLRNLRNLRNLRRARITSMIPMMGITSMIPTRISMRVMRDTQLKMTPEGTTIVIHTISPVIQVDPAIQVAPVMIYQSLQVSHSCHHPPFLFPFQLNYHQLHPIINTNPFFIISVTDHVCFR